MNADELRAIQAPLKARYKDDPATAQVTLRATGHLRTEAQACRVEGLNHADAGLHPMAGGDGSFACAGDRLLQALVGCAGVTLATVATALGIPVRSGTLTVEGDLDFRGTLGVSRDVPVGFTAIRMHARLDADATAEQLEKLLQLTERYCVVFQTLKTPPQLSSSLTTATATA